ncbi:unnamed protein product [Anisakis simplex]|uniref:DNA-directed RNA polymerase III subunit RPC8 (inferred by orthology to a human protein) n=1 Tax=Anisakis simplex TaxID=6269 RepID=A0A0M3J5J5_ANISI|nr:unnamed protein product [Anisakis simplex]VDK20395.1 unnamed protein product [Anisakis simplex]
MDPGKIVWFRVIENVFRDVDPDASEDDKKKAKSYEIIGSMSETGLGCVVWWVQAEEGAEFEDEEEGEGDGDGNNQEGGEET